jgi:hypothetical protein
MLTLCVLAGCLVAISFNPELLRTLLRLLR